MSRTKRIAFLILAVASALAFAIGLSLTREPVYGGKRLSTWLATLGEDAPEKRLPAVEAIRDFGTNASAAVIRLLQYKESTLKQKIREFARSQTLVKLQFEEPRHRRRRALIACDALGPVAAPVIPTLLDMLITERPPEPHIPYLLARIGPAAIPALNSALTNNEKVIRMGAACCLEMLRTNAAFLHPENSPVEEQDYFRRTCQYNVMMLQAAFREYEAQHGRKLTDMPPPSLPDDFDPKAFEASVQEHAKQRQRTNSPSPFE